MLKSYFRRSEFKTNKEQHHKLEEQQNWTVKDELKWKLFVDKVITLIGKPYAMRSLFIVNVHHPSNQIAKINKKIRPYPSDVSDSTNRPKVTNFSSHQNH